MDYEIVSKINIDKKQCVPVGEFYYDPKIDGLYFEGAYPFPVQLLVSEKLTRVQVTPMFVKLPFILKGWINLDILLREIELIKFAFEGKLMLHASCVDNTLIVGLPNSGKTYRTLMSVKNGGKFISEEYTIIDGKTAYPYKEKSRTCLSPRTIEDCEIDITMKERVELYLRTLRATFMPFMFEACIWKEFELSGDSAEIKQIVYGSTNVIIKDYPSLVVLTENEFPFMDNPFLQAYALASGFDLLFAQNIQRDLIRTFIKQVYGGKNDIRSNTKT